MWNRTVHTFCTVPYPTKLNRLYRTVSTFPLQVASMYPSTISKLTWMCSYNFLMKMYPYFFPLDCFVPFSHDFDFVTSCVCFCIIFFTSAPPPPPRFWSPLLWRCRDLTKYKFNNVTVADSAYIFLKSDIWSVQAQMPTMGFRFHEHSTLCTHRHTGTVQEFCSGD